VHNTLSVNKVEEVEVTNATNVAYTVPKVKTFDRNLTYFTRLSCFDNFDIRFLSNDV